MRSALSAVLLLTASVAAQTPWDVAPNSIALVAPEAAADEGTSEGIRWTWAPDPRWLEGADAGRQTFGGGLDFGYRFLGSSVAPRDVPPVRIVFDKAEQTTARAFGRHVGYGDLGAGLFRGAAYDVSDPENPRRLNVAFVEDATAKTPDGVWNPDASVTGAREYLLILASDYDGDGSTYAGATARDLDTYYGLVPRLVAGHPPYETSPATFDVEPQPLREVSASADGNGVAVVQWTAAAGSTDGGTVRVLDGDALLAEAAPEAGAVRLEGLDAARTYTFHVQLIDGAGTPVRTLQASVRPEVSRGVAAVSSRNPGRSDGYGDVWGYVAPGGTEYALLAARGGGLSVLDVSAAPAAPPVEVGFVPTASGASDSKDVKTYGHYAYLVNEVGPVQIIDLADPTNPVEVGVLEVQAGTPNGGSHNLLVANDHLWVVGGRTDGTAGVRVYALADPTAPSYVGEYQVPAPGLSYYHDFEVRGTLAFGARIYNGEGIDVLDVSDPTDIRLVTTFSYPGAGAHNTCTTEDGAYVFVGDEIGSAGNWMRTFAIGDLDNVELVDEIVVDPEAVVHNCYVRGDLLFAAHYTEGLRVFDVSDPVAPVEVAFYDTYRQPGYGYRGAWTAYPYLPSGKVLVSDMQTGLWVITLDPAAVDAEAAAPEAGLVLTVAPNPLGASASVRFTLPEAARVRLSVFDVRGREVRTLVDGPRPAGPHAVDLERGSLPAGVYLVRLGVEGRTAATARATVLR